MDGDTILTLLMAACGSGVFLRLIAKEKDRRDRYLQLRFEEKLKELQKEAELQKKSESSGEADQE